MKIDMFDVEEFIRVNDLKEVTSSVLFQRNDLPDPRGLISNEIFGITTKARKTTFAYIDLGKPYLHPLAYKAIKRIFRNVDKIINGETYYIITDEGELKVDPNGNTGIDWLYDNWEKIKWQKDETNIAGMRNERIDLLQDKPKNQIFMKYQIVIPAFYRDIRSTSSGGETDDINNLYGRLIRAVSENKDSGRFDFQFHATDFNIQRIIEAIYNYCKQKIEKKQGLIRKYLMGKNVDYCTRTVITAPIYHGNRPDDVFTDFEHASIPISQVCALCYPFIFRYVKNFFEQNIFDNKEQLTVYDPRADAITDNAVIENPEATYTDKYIEKMIAQYEKDQECRFNLFPVKIQGSKKLTYLAFTGRRIDPSTKEELSDIYNRPMTWTDLLFMACVDATKDKHCLITRYPLLDEFGIFIAKIRVASTTKTTPIMVNSVIYKWYPEIDVRTPVSEIGAHFIDSVSFSNSYLEGIEGDYDGDQVTVKIPFTQEANEECEQVMNKKSYFINSAGNNIRAIGKEALQTFYVITKDPYGVEKHLSKEDKEFFLNIDPKDITFESLVDWFGITTDITSGKNSAVRPVKFHPTDTLTISKNEYKLVHSNTPVKTTLGRLIFNKLMVEGLNFDDFLEYQNEVLYAGKFKAFDRSISDKLKDDKITVNQMKSYINMRDWFGLQLHGVITTSYTMKVLKTPKEVTKLKEELFKKHADALADGDAAVMEQIEKELISEMKKQLHGDIGMDLYESGARGSVSNNYKNINLTRGAVYNPITGKYDIVKNSLMDGLSKYDIPTHSNVIITGSFPKAVNYFVPCRLKTV